MIYALVVAALSFSAPPSLTRRDMAVGMGAAAAAMVPGLAFAETAAERKAKEKASLSETLKALDSTRVMDSSMKALQGSTYNPNGNNPYGNTGTM